MSALLGKEDSSLVKIGADNPLPGIRLPFEQKHKAINRSAGGMAPIVNNIMASIVERHAPHAHSNNRRESASREYSSSTCTFEEVHYQHSLPMTEMHCRHDLTCTPLTPSLSISSVNTPGSLSMVVQLPADISACLASTTLLS